MNRVLALYILPNINTLRLDLGDDRCSGYQIETWIIVAVARKVRNLDISHSFKMKFILPVPLLTCETLIDLRLDCSFVILVPNTVWLPRLKKLNLFLVKYEVDESLPRLLSGCPVLEYLQVTLEIKNPELVTFFNISSPTLKRLEVDLDTMYDDPEAYDHVHRLKIDTPALECLKLYDGFFKQIESGMMTSLTEANIFLHNDMEKGDDLVYSQSVLEFVNCLCNVKRLRLDLEYSTKIIDCVATVRFQNLTELELVGANGLFLSKFLENADSLEILILHELCHEGERAWVEPEQVPTCLSSHLRTVKMFDIGASSDFEIVRYLLRNARILESFEISHWQRFRNKNTSIQKISQVKRGSKVCELAFV